MPSIHPHWPLLLFVGCLLGGALQLGVLWWSDLPLGVPGEWTWARVRFAAEDIFGLLPAIVIAGLFLGFVWLGAERIERTGPLGKRLWGCGLALVGSLWLLAAVGSVPGIAGTSRVPFVLYYPRTEGYFFQARYQVDDLSRFLSTYRESISDSDDPENYLHIGTHPPGLTAGYATLLSLVERHPGLISISEATQPAAVRKGFQVLQQNARLSGQDVRTTEIAVLWLATLITLFAAGGTSWPLFHLLEKSTSPRGAWCAAACWPLVPAVAIFLPKSDALFPILLVLIQWQWLESLERQSLLRGMVAGSFFSGGMLLSLAFAPLGVILALQWSLAWATDAILPSPQPAGRCRLPWRPLVGAAIPLLILIFVCAIFFQMNLLSIWMQNARNHAAFYSHHSRTYLMWLWVNPLELGMAVGLPLALCALASLPALLTDRQENSWDGELDPHGTGQRRLPSILTLKHLPLLAAFAVWGLLWVSGKNMGEAARLWLFLMPYVVWGAAVSFDRLVRIPHWLPWLWTLQLLVCLLTVCRIDGFHFDDLLR